jgi:hypothetical protein
MHLVIPRYFGCGPGIYVARVELPERTGCRFDSSRRSNPGNCTCFLGKMMAHADHRYIETALARPAPTFRFEGWRFASGSREARDDRQNN